MFFLLLWMFAQLTVCPATGWRPVHVVVRLSPKFSWDRLLYTVYKFYIYIIFTVLPAYDKKKEKRLLPCSLLSCRS